jgi:hypothetical protein
MQYVTVTLMACQAGCCQEREWPPRQGVPDLGAGLPGGTGASTLRLRVQYPPLVFVGADLFVVAGRASHVTKFIP